MCLPALQKRKSLKPLKERIVALQQAIQAKEKSFTAAHTKNIKPEIEQLTKRMTEVCACCLRGCVP